MAAGKLFIPHEGLGPDDRDGLEDRRKPAIQLDEEQASYKRRGSLRRSFSTRSQSLSGSSTPFFASSMILLATASRATSGRLVYLRAAHVISNATPMIRLASGSKACGSGAIVCSWFLLIRWAQRARCQAEIPLIALFRFPRPALFGQRDDGRSVGRMGQQGRVQDRGRVRCSA